METMPFQKLFKKSSTGAIQEWSISVENSTIVTRWGQVDGAIQETRDTVSSGKNIGKANATEPWQQALSEAEANWQKHLKKGYVKSLDDARAGIVDDVIEGGVFPMLALKFAEQGHKITYPAYAQPKLDGHRCIAVVEDGKASLWSRTRKPITGLPHLIKALESWSQFNGVPFITLDGEFYNHDYRHRFEELSSFIRSADPKPGHEVVQYHIYDVVNDQPQGGRLALLQTLAFQYLVPVHTITVNDEDELMLAFETFLAEGFEGAMVRNAAGVYKENRRSENLQKIKKFEDAEFMVIGIEEGRGKLAGHAIFVCDFEGRKFRAKMKGKTADLKQYFEHPDRAIGKLLTVKFQGYTKKNRVPRFGVAWRLREDI